MELLPLWLAPNMVTLIGFFFILGNIGLLVIFMPDLIGPVRTNRNPAPAPGRPFISWEVAWTDEHAHAAL